jgi:hypothetical protein
VYDKVSSFIHIQHNHTDVETKLKQQNPTCGVFIRKLTNKLLISTSTIPTPRIFLDFFCCALVCMWTAGIANVAPSVMRIVDCRD